MKPITAVIACTAAAGIALAGSAQIQQQTDKPGVRPGERPAQTERPMDKRSLQERMAHRDTTLHHIADIHNKRVENMQGERLGTIDTLIADVQGAQITYGVVSVGGFLGIADTLVAVPWEAFQLRPMFDGLVLDMTRSELEAAPSFSRGEWPNFADQNWSREVHGYYGTTPHWEHDRMRDRDRIGDRDRIRDRQPGQQMQQVERQLEQAFTRAGVDRQTAQMRARELAQRFERERPDMREMEQSIQREMTQAGVEAQRARDEARRIAQQVHPMLDRDVTRDPGRPMAPGELVARTTNLIGTRVENRAGENLGNLDNIAMDLETGKMDFCVIGVGGFLGLWQTHVTVPWQALEITRVEDRDYRIILDATREQLDRAPEYDMDKWPTHRDVEWAAGIFPGFEPRRPGEPRRPMGETGRQQQPRDR